MFPSRSKAIVVSPQVICRYPTYIRARWSHVSWRSLSEQEQTKSLNEEFVPKDS